MAGRRAAREESWNSVHYSEASNDLTDDAYDADEDMDEGAEPLLTNGDVRRVLHPLRAAAERVGKQVERFAESLDRFSPRSQGKTAADCSDVLPVIQEYENIASETVKRLRRQHEPERQAKLKRSLKRRIKQASGRSTPSDQYIDSDAEDPSSTTVSDLQRWEGERQTWQLLGLMVQIQFPSAADAPATQDQRFQRPQNTPRPHRYSAEHEVWDHFLEKEPAMWEKHVVVEWLKSNASSMGQDIDTVVEELEAGADRGSGLWAHGWLYSKEAVKNQKRLRSWPQFLDPNSPGIADTLVEPDSKAPLVTQLDPDAASRQERALMKEDVFFERATWLACWEMTRRGHSWQSIREWCQKRVEIWRALSMRGDPRLSCAAPDLGPSMASGWQSRALWRRMCAKSADQGGIDDYERAVYGALSGHLESVEAVSRSWDDVLFAHYNSQLLQSFDFFVRGHFPDRVKEIDSLRWDGVSAVAAAASGEQMWDQLLQAARTKDEAASPMKLLQGSIIAKKAREYLADQAYTLCSTLRASDGEYRKVALPLEQRGKLGPTAQIRLEDFDTLRMLTHVALVLQDLGHLQEFEPAVEQIIAAYVDFLGKAGKQQLLPLYASRLSPEAAAHCMARQLPSILDTAERQTVLRLMEQYGMDVPAILLMQLVLITQDRPVDPTAKLGFPPLRIIEPVAAGANALPQIRQGFMGQGFAQEDYDLINGMEWYLLIDMHWKETMYAGCLVYKYLLLTGSFAAARELASRVSFRTISTTKTRDILGESVDLSSLWDGDDNDDGGPATQAVRPRHRRRRSSDQRRAARQQRAFLLDSAQTFRDFENLISLLHALEAWAAAAARAGEVHTTGAAAWKAGFQEAHAAVVEAAEPLLQGRWLADPSPGAEEAEFAALRAAYLPELVLAYNTALVIGGTLISRDILVRSMDLAALVADGRSGLAACFVAAGRMAELVRALAVASRFVLKADEAGNRKGRGLRRKKSGEALGIWSVPASATGR